jgi:tRNA (cytidine/uridine-2'-O-)-methyltransferase
MAEQSLLQIALFEPLIPQNTGNIGRLTTANKIPLHLIEPLGFSLDEKKVRRAGLDYWKHADIRLHPNWQAFRQSLGSSRLIAFSKHASTRYDEHPFERGDCLLFGKETKGLPAELLADPAIIKVRLPMRAIVVRSLNLANSVAIGLYEALRQFDFPEERALEEKL